LFVSLAGILVALVWAYNWNGQPANAAQQWGDAIRVLGIEPVFPPEEDITVGDIFVIANDTHADVNSIDSKPYRTHTIRLLHHDLTNILQESYKQTYAFSNRSPDHLGGAAAVADQNPSQGSVFAPVRIMHSLPIAAFPHLKIKQTKSSGFVGSISGATSWLLNAGANSDSSTDVSLDEISTYGVPSAYAISALAEFCHNLAEACTDDGMRKALSSVVGQDIYEKCRARVFGVCLWQGKEYITPVEIGLVTRVYLTEQITTQIENARGVDLKADPANPGNEACPKIAHLTGGDPAKCPPADPKPSGHSASIAGSNLMAITFDYPKFPRPLVFGVNSVRWQPSPQPSLQQPPIDRVSVAP
jgi:hypothetical protein